MCGVALYLQTGRYRIVKRADKSDKGQGNGSVTESDNKSKTIVEEFESSFAKHDIKLFVLYAERLAAAIDKKNMNETQINELSNIREKINLCRYGGGKITEVEMDQIYGVLKKFSI